MAPFVFYSFIVPCALFIYQLPVSTTHRTESAATATAPQTVASIELRELARVDFSFATRL